MAVQVGNSWVSEAAYAYATRKSSGKGKSANTLENLSKEFKNLKFTTDTKPYSATGRNNMAISPEILKEMENNPDKKLEYEALLYDCNEAVKNLPEKTADGAEIKSFGFILNSDGSLGAWSVSEDSKSTRKQTFILDKKKKSGWMDQIAGRKTSGQDTYDKSDQPDSAVYSVHKMSAQDRAGLVKRLQAEQEARQRQLIDIVKQTLNKQAGAYNKATDPWKFLAGGGFQVDAATKSKAQNDISEDGYYGVKQTSQRLFDFACALAGDDVEQMKKMQKAMEKGFRQATGAWGKELPGICQETFQAANKLFQDYYASKKAEEIEA